MGVRPVKAVRLLGQDLVLFKDAQGRWGLLDRDCPHRGADLSFGRTRATACAAPSTAGSSTPPAAARQTRRAHGQQAVRARAPAQLPGAPRKRRAVRLDGPEDVTPPPFPAFDCFAAPATHSFAFKGLWNCNWLQAFEVGIDPAHPSFLHRFFCRTSRWTPLATSYGRKQFRSASAGRARWRAPGP
jgi:phthalate 4,5-dioxygenase oxygenase subunit